MKKIKRKYIVIVIILIALFGVVFTKALTRQVDVAYCESNNILIHPPLTFTSDYILRFHEGIGSMNMHGIADVSGKKYIISRVIHFTYVRNGHTYFLTNTNTHSLDKEEVRASGIDNHFPGFFKAKGRKLVLTLEFDKNKKPMFFINGSLGFYCN